MSRIEGRRPNASVHRMTPGCLPSAGWNHAALQLPSGVLIVTSFSTTAGPAGIAPAGSEVAATPVATDSATKSRRRRPPGSGLEMSCSCSCLALIRGSSGWVGGAAARCTRISRPPENQAFTRASYARGKPLEPIAHDDSGTRQRRLPHAAGIDPCDPVEDRLAHRDLRLHRPADRAV